VRHPRTSIRSRCGGRYPASARIPESGSCGASSLTRTNCCGPSARCARRAYRPKVLNLIPVCWQNSRCDSPLACKSSTILLISSALRRRAKPQVCPWPTRRIKRGLSAFDYPEVAPPRGTRVAAETPETIQPIFVLAPCRFILRLNPLVPWANSPRPGRPILFIDGLDLNCDDDVPSLRRVIQSTRYISSLGFYRVDGNSPQRPESDPVKRFRARAKSLAAFWRRENAGDWTAFRDKTRTPLERSKSAASTLQEGGFKQLVAIRRGTRDTTAILQPVPAFEHHHRT